MLREPLLLVADAARSRVAGGRQHRRRLRGVRVEGRETLSDVLVVPRQALQLGCLAVDNVFEV